jgi:hypothetical protein
MPDGAAIICDNESGEGKSTKRDKRRKVKEQTTLENQSSMVRI